MSEQEKAYWTAEVAKMLEISPASINRWTRVLEELGYPIIAGTEGRAYIQKDIDVLKKIREIMNNGPKTKTSDAARQALGLKSEERYIVGDRTQASRNQDQSTECDRTINQVNEPERVSDLVIEQVIDRERQYVMNIFRDVINSLEDKVVELEERLEEQNIRHRMERVDVWSIRTDVRLQLKKDAEEAWMRLPDSERKHKVFRGLFLRSIENEEKKRWFVNEFIMDRIDDEVARRIAEKEEQTVTRRTQSRSFELDQEN